MTAPKIVMPSQIVMRATASLIGYARNSRTHDERQIDVLCKSITEYGFTNPILIDGDRGVIAGHGRIMAAEKLGLVEVPCIELRHLTNEQKRAYLIADNAIADMSTFNEALLAQELADLSGVGIEATDLGFDAAEVDRLMETLGVDFGGKPEGDPDAVPEAPVVPTSKLGDVWLLGKHRVMCGSADSDDVQTVMGGRKADLLLTDPPYGVSYADKNAFLNAIAPGNRIQKEIANDHMAVADMKQFWTRVLSNGREACHDKAAYYVFSPQGGDKMMMMMMSINDAKWQLKHELVWVKNNHVLGRSDYHYKHEPILYGWKHDGTHEFFGGSSCFSVLNFDKPMKNDLHPTMKPLELCAYLIKNSTREGGLVLDLFLGSGSTLIASEQTGRACCGTELDPAYVDVIVRRWQDFTGQAATLDGDGRTFAEIAEAHRA
jgi:DNA modification methylase